MHQRIEIAEMETEEGTIRIEILGAGLEALPPGDGIETEVEVEAGEAG